MMTGTHPSETESHLASAPTEPTITEATPVRRRSRYRPAPQLFLLMECERPLASSSRYHLNIPDLVEIGRGKGGERDASLEEVEGKDRLTIRVPDRWMSSMHARLLRTDEGWAIEDAGSRNGLLINGVSQRRALLSDGDVLQLGHTLFLYRAAELIAAGDRVITDAAEVSPPAPGLATLAGSLAREFELIMAIVDSALPILIQGQSGTGKELLAQAVHLLSHRPGKFVAVNCGALPEQLLPSELFGHVRGAFTDAVQDRPGLIRSAHMGTLFLDEIGDLPLASQTAFLRVLQEREVIPIGSSTPIPVDLRIVAATHRDLAQMVTEGAFREDLYARLSGHTITLPPLCQRREDLGLIIALLLRRIAGDRALDITIQPEAAYALCRHDWPLNVRQLEQCLRKAVVVAHYARIECEHLRLEAPAPAQAPKAPAPAASRPLSPAQQAIYERLVATLNECHGNVSLVADKLQKKRTQIYRWLKQFHIEPNDYRS
jgi:transcriptional regulator with PAS, ATPase and Fis domain